MLKIRHIGKLLILAILFLLSPKLHAQESDKSSSVGGTVSVAPDDCALFIWVGNQSRLLFISSSSDRLVYSAINDGQHFIVSSNSPVDKFGQYQNQDIRDEAGQTSRLRLDDPVDVSGFMLYKSGIISLPSPDGWDRIESVQAVSGCNKSGADTLLGLDTKSVRFVLPSWLETPMQLSQIKKQTVSRKVVEAAPPEPQLLKESYKVEDNAVESSMLAQSSFETIEPKPINETITNIDSQHTVQLGAFPSEVLAQKGWVKLQEEAEYLRNKEPIFQIADIKDLGLLYRLRLTGFPDKNRALEFCARLKSDDVDCFVPTTLPRSSK